MGIGISALGSNSDTEERSLTEAQIEEDLAFYRKWSMSEVKVRGAGGGGGDVFFAWRSPRLRAALQSRLGNLAIAQGIHCRA